MRLRYVVRKEFQEIRRNKMVLRMIVMTPIIQLMIMGYAANMEVKDVPLAICDEDHSAESRALLAEIAAMPYFEVVTESAESLELDGYLYRGEATLGLHLPPDFHEAAFGHTAVVQLLVDGSDAVAAGVASSYLVGALADRGRELATRRLERRGGSSASLPRVEADIRIWYNPDLKSSVFYVPGVAALILLILIQLLTALAIVREREIGTLEQLVVTPIRSWELMLGKMIPFIIIGVIDFTTVLLIATLWFKVPFRGSLPFLYGTAGLFLIPTLGMGLIVSTASRTQQQAVLLNFFLTMPSVLLSGFVFPIANMPQWLQCITYAVPLRYFLHIVRAVFLKGAGPGILWPECLAMVGLGLLFFTVGVLRFRKRVQ